MKEVNIKNKIVMIKKGASISASDENGDVVQYTIHDDLFVQVQYTDKTRVTVDKVVYRNRPESEKPHLKLIK